MIEGISLGQISAALAFVLALWGSIELVVKKISTPFKKIEETINTVDKKVDTLAENYFQQMKILKDSQAAMIRDKIKNYYFKEAVKNKCITAQDHEVVNTLYESYTDLGGNGLITKEMDFINGLPIVDELPKKSTRKKTTIK